MSNKKLAEISKRMVYDPIDWQKRLGYKLSTKYCAASVSESGRGVGFAQCGRKPVETLGGYGWCRQHAKQIKSEAGLLDNETWYIAGVKYGEAYVTKIEFDGVKYVETPVIGDRQFYSRAAIKKHERLSDTESATRYAIGGLKRLHGEHISDAKSIEREIERLEKGLP